MYHSHQSIFVQKKKKPVFNWKENSGMWHQDTEPSTRLFLWPLACKTNCRKTCIFMPESKKTFILRGTWKNFFILKGEPFPSKKSEISQLQKQLSTQRKIQGFWQATHMTTCLTCIGLPVLNSIHKLKIGGQQPPKISKEKLFSCFWKQEPPKTKFCI